MYQRQHRSHVIALTTFLGLFIASIPAVAAPPKLFGLVVDPIPLMAGSGTQTVTFTVSVTDPDGNLAEDKVKVRLKFTDGNKVSFQLFNDGTGRYSGAVNLDTSVAQEIGVKVKAKDLVGERATPINVALNIVSAPAASFQGHAQQAGVLDITVVNPALNANLAATAPQALLNRPTSVTFHDASHFSTLNFAFDNSFFTDTDFVGAVDPNNPDPWWNEWTLHEGNGSLLSTSFHPLQAEIQGGQIVPAASANCPGGTVSAGLTAPIFGVNFPICLMNSNLTSNTTLTNDHVYLIVGTIAVGDGSDLGDTPSSVSNVTLTIQAGVQTFGDTTADTAGIVITRGSDVVINGTRAMPVVMSSADDGAIDTSVNNFSGHNEWGGLIVDGFAVVNEGGEVLSEAAPPGVDRFFGGNDPADSSGAIRYVVITESGQEFRTDEEIQGLTLEGVGSGTVIDFVQIHHSGDDGIEWFGGTVNSKHLVITAPDDDALDMDLGFQGGIQYALVKQSNDRGDRGIESDNNGDNFDQTPRSMPTLANITIIGNVGKDSATTTGALHREGMGGFFHKIIITDENAAGGALLQNGCLDIDDSQARIDEGTLRYADAIFNCSAGAVSPAEGDEVVQ